MEFAIDGWETKSQHEAGVKGAHPQNSFYRSPWRAGEPFAATFSGCKVYTVMSGVLTQF